MKNCNIVIHTTIDYMPHHNDIMNQKLNYYKALQIAAAMTPRVR